MWMMLLHPSEVGASRQDQIHRIDCLSSQDDSERLMAAKSYGGLLAESIDGEHIHALEVRRWELRSRIRIAEAVTRDQIGTPRIAAHEVGLDIGKPVHQDRRPLYACIPALLHTILDQEAHQLCRQVPREIAADVRS